MPDDVARITGESMQKHPGSSGSRESCCCNPQNARLQVKHFIPCQQTGQQLCSGWLFVPVVSCRCAMGRAKADADAISTLRFQMSNINRTMQDMSKERRRAEEALQASERMQSEMKRGALDELYNQRGSSTVQVYSRSIRVWTP